jgi:beta-lactamase superfamily II metal-dependent hydrolase
VKVHVLGPSRGRDVIRDMDPPQGKSFLRMRNAVSLNPSLPPPFPNEAPLPSNPVAATMTPQDEDAIQRAGSLEDLAIAVALDKAVNGTSLMLILEIAGSYLLFPGDAQWGTWAAAMADPEWSEMLSRIAFYKVGHHGSHNATPLDFVKDMMPEKITAMVSTRTRNIWPDIPRIPLLDGLKAKHVSVVRSDLMAQAVSPFHVDAGVAEVQIPL